MAMEEILRHLGLWNSEWWIFVYNLPPFASNLFNFSCVDPDPYWEYGSTKLRKMDPIWIRIHITSCPANIAICGQVWEGQGAEGAAGWGEAGAGGTVLLTPEPQVGTVNLPNFGQFLTLTYFVACKEFF